MSIESVLAHQWMDGLGGVGIEIGPAAHNLFGIRGTLFVGVDEAFYQQHQIELCRTYQKLDIQAWGEELPFRNDSLSFVITSHVLEHFADPIQALQEWWRVLRPGGVLFTIAPHKERTFDKDRERTPLAELVERHRVGARPEHERGHCSVWVTEDLVELFAYLDLPVAAVQDTDDKVGNGFAIVARKQEAVQ